MSSWAKSQCKGLGVWLGRHCTALPTPQTEFTNDHEEQIPPSPRPSLSANGLHRPHWGNLAPGSLLLHLLPLPGWSLPVLQLNYLPCSLSDPQTSLLSPSPNPGQTTWSRCSAEGLCVYTAGSPSSPRFTQSLFWGLF